MKQIRQKTFETNSSSTHSLVLGNRMDNYIPLSKHLKIEWIDTDDYYFLDTLEGKLSYLISHLANKLKWSCNTYEELLEEISNNFEYKQIEEYIQKKFDKKIRFPSNKNGIYDDVEYIAEINHQLIPWGQGGVIEEVLDELIRYSENEKEERIYDSNIELDLSFEQKLDLYFEDKSYIKFGRD